MTGEEDVSVKGGAECEGRTAGSRGLGAVEVVGGVSGRGGPVEAEKAGGVLLCGIAAKDGGVDGGGGGGG